MNVKYLTQVFKDKSLDGKKITFIGTGGNEHELSYSELYSRAKSVLGYLQKKGIQENQEVVFQVEDYEVFLILFWACLLGKIIPVPVSLGKNEEHLRKVVKIWEILNSPCLVSSEAQNDKIKTYDSKNRINRFISIEEIKRNYTGQKGELSKISPNDIAFIQFSSGSTGDPKGVVLTHKNLVTNAYDLLDAFGSPVDSDSSYLSWMPLTHDMGMISFHLCPVLGHFNQYLLPTDIFIRRPALWLQKISEHKVTTSSSPNFGYKYLLDNFNTDSNKGLDLSSLKVIVNGAEPISSKLCFEFTERFKEYGLGENVILPAYGLAEASVGVCTSKPGDSINEFFLDRNHLNTLDHIVYEQDNENSVSFVGVGKSIKNTQVRIVDDSDNLLDDEIIGHIQIKGDNVTSGYYNNKNASKALFSKDGFARTGDLGFIKNEILIITGRAKDILFINGQNYYPQDIERNLEEIDEIELGKVVVTSILDSKSDKEEIIVFVLFKKSAEKFTSLALKVKQQIITKLGIEVKYIVPIKKVPKTTSGKVQRYKLGKDFADGKFSEINREVQKQISQYQNSIFVEPTTETEIKLAEIWKETLGINQIGIDNNFLEIGGNSLTLVKITEDIARQLNCEISLNDFIRSSSIRKIGEYIDSYASNNIKSAYPACTPNQEKAHDEFGLTDVQMAYLMGRDTNFELGGVATHGYYEFETKLDIELLEKSFNKVIAHQPMLRAVISPNGKQQILKTVPEYSIVKESIVDLHEAKQAEKILAERKRMSHQVFKSDSWPLFEMKALEITNEQTLLLFSFDLLIIDGSSIRLLVKELMSHYNNNDYQPPKVDINFRDYVQSLNELKNTSLYERDKKYWSNKLNEFPFSPALPLKQDPSNVVKPHFQRLQKKFSKKDWSILMDTAKEFGITASSLLCAAFSDILAHWSNQPQHALNLTVFNRYPFHKQTSELIGDFTSVVLLDIDSSAGKSFWDRAATVQHTIFEALEHRHYDGIEFIRDFSKHNSMGKKAVMPVVFTSMLLSDNEKDSSLEEFGFINYSVSQTPQVYIDFQAFESKSSISLSWDYVEELFDKSLINSMFDQFINLLNQVMKKNKAPEIKANISDTKLFEDYNRTKESIPQTTLIELFYDSLEKYPDNTAIVNNGISTTYSELDKKSNQLAKYLLSEGITRHSKVGVSADRKANTIANILAILKVGAAYVPIDTEYPENRKAYILENCNSKLLLTPETYDNENVADLSDTKLDLINEPADVAYIIFTSGSTGKPKGVVITHGAVCNTIIDINQKFGVHDQDRIIALSSLCFDLSVYDVFGALSSGASMVQINDLKDIPNIQQVLNENNITIWNSVPAIMDMLVANMNIDSDDEVNYWQIDNSSNVTFNYNSNNGLRLVMLSGDWIPLNLPAKINENFPDAKTISLGGATEASIWSIYYPVEEVNNKWNSIPYGFPLANQTFYVLNYKQQLCPVGAEGELYIGGVGLASEYHNDEEKTKNAFIDHPGLGRLYRTGDHGIMHKEGYIEFLGRKDHQVKIRGHRIELGEIENCINTLGHIQNSVVIDYSDSNNIKHLCAYVVTTNRNEDLLRSYLANYLPEYMLPRLIIWVDNIPLTSNGKVDRRALPTPDFTAMESKYVEPRNTQEKKLAEIWAETLKIKKVGINDNFLDIGGDSVTMVSIVNRINHEFNAGINYQDFLNANTIAKLANLISYSSAPTQTVIYEEAEADKENANLPFALTEVQTAYFMGRGSNFEMGGISTHAYFEIETKLDIQKLSSSLNQLISRQPMLRAIVKVNGTQIILTDVPRYEINVKDISKYDKNEQQAYILLERDRMSHHIFQTDKWPLFEIKALKTSASKHYLLLGFDLLIADGTSMRIFIKELMNFYYDRKESIPAFDFTFRDYINSLSNFKLSSTYEKDKAYWSERIKTLPAAPALPLKQKPEKISKPHFKRLAHTIDKKNWDKLKTISKSQGVTPSALLFTAFSRVLAYWSNQPEHTINVTMFTRYPFNKNVNNIIGDFTSLLLIDSNIKPGSSFWENANDAQNNLMKALEHRHYDGIEIIREISREKNMGNSAVMPVVFTSMVFSGDEVDSSLDDLGEVKMGVSQTSQVYLDYQVMETKGKLEITWDYVDELFEERIIKSMFSQYNNILDKLTIEEAILKPELSIEDQVILKEYNNTKSDIEPETLSSMFTRQAQKTPLNKAVVMGDDSITYEELDKKSNQVARYLLDKGTETGSSVGVLANRDIQAIINIYGILKAGAAYIPVDPEYPEKRRSYILENSNSKILLPATDEFYKGLSDDEINVYYSLENIAYTIYTSGSTGKPKGVVISHKAVSNTIKDINKKFNVCESDRVIGISSLCFDLSVYDIFGTLSAGATLVLIPNIRDVQYISETVEKNGITIWNSVPAIMDMTLEHLEFENQHGIDYWQSSHAAEMQVSLDKYQSLRLVLLSGDWIPLNLPERIEDTFSSAEVISLGGATEASIWSIYYPVKEVKSAWKSIPYGIPLDNQEFYVLNYNMEQCPVDVEGELYIGGVGVANEYMNDAEKTNQSFIQHPAFGRLYKTGDFGVLRKEGYIEFLGRKDFQIKIRGHRIELGEIENQLSKYPELKNAIVIDQEDKEQKKCISAFIVCDKEIDIEHVKSYLESYLPDYMIPKYITQLEKIPLTSNGKLDRKALPTPESAGTSKKVTYVAPGNAIEQTIVDITKEILQAENIGVYDNFFDLGATSVHAIKASNKLQEKLQKEIPVLAIFEHSTIKALAKYISLLDKEEEELVEELEDNNRTSRSMLGQRRKRLNN